MKSKRERLPNIIFINREVYILREHLLFELFFSQFFLLDTSDTCFDIALYMKCIESFEVRKNNKGWDKFIKLPMYLLEIIHFLRWF